MKKWIAKRVFCGIDRACELTGHVGGCWLFHNRLSQALIGWATEQFTDEELFAL